MVINDDLCGLIYTYYTGFPNEDFVTMETKRDKLDEKGDWIWEDDEPPNKKIRARNLPTAATRQAGSSGRPPVSTAVAPGSRPASSTSRAATSGSRPASSTSRAATSAKGRAATSAPNRTSPRITKEKRGSNKPPPAKTAGTKRGRNSSQR